MRLQLENTELLLREDRPLGLVQGKGCTIRCLAGIAWLTVAGEAEDRFLSAGQDHRLESDGLALIESLGQQATIRLEPAASGFHPPFTRLISRLAGQLDTIPLPGLLRHG
ncbi:MAG: hypothetical protein H6R10_861 [Rhodocyclaceae bacterium]|nr:hypothetical protein [Rhodocyclaceae bacterium]